MKITKSSKIIITIALLFGTGCTTRTITWNGATYKSSRFGNKETIGGIELRSGTNVFRVDSFKSDQVQAIEIAVKAAVETAIKSMKP